MNDDDWTIIGRCPRCGVRIGKYAPWGPDLYHFIATSEPRIVTVMGDWLNPTVVLCHCMRPVGLTEQEMKFGVA